jgi:hypothetical protein
MTNTQTAPQVLKDGVIYNAYDRHVCAKIQCAGYSARTTGVNIDGFVLAPITNLDRAEWPTDELGPITCDCGSLVDGR